MPSSMYPATFPLTVCTTVASSDVTSSEVQLQQLAAAIPAMARKTSVLVFISFSVDYICALIHTNIVVFPEFAVVVSFFLVFNFVQAYFLFVQMFADLFKYPLCIASMGIFCYLSTRKCIK